MKPLLVAVAALLLVQFGPVRAQTVYKCKGENGQASFQQQPCDGHGTGAVEVKPMNTVEGRPDGERRVRREAAASERREAAERRYNERLQRIQDATRLRPCYTELEIRNATMDKSFARSLQEKRAAERLEYQMRSCRE